MSSRLCMRGGVIGQAEHCRNRPVNHPSILNNKPQPPNEKHTHTHLAYVLQPPLVIIICDNILIGKTFVRRFDGNCIWQFNNLIISIGITELIIKCVEVFVGMKHKWLIFLTNLTKVSMQKWWIFHPNFINSNRLFDSLFFLFFF